MIAIVILAFGARVGWIAANSWSFPAGDTRTYVKLAANIVAGSGYTRNGETPTAFVVPLYPLILAGTFKITAGEHLLPLQLLQALLGALTALVAALLARHVFDEPISLLAGALVGFHPYLIQWTGYVLTETVFVFLLSCSLLALAYLLTSKRLYQSFATGLLLGLASLTRPTGVFLSVALGFAWPAIFRRFAKYRRIILLGLLGFVVIYGPWAIRSSLVLGDLVITSTNADPYYRANNSTVTSTVAKATGGWGEDRYQVPKNITSNLTELEIYKALRQAAISFVVENPIEFLYRCLVRLVYYWSPTFPSYSRFHNIVNLFFYVPLYSFAVLGASLMLKSRMYRFLWVFVIVVVFFTAVHAATIVEMNQRYRLPLQPILCILGSAGFIGSVRNSRIWRQRRACMQRNPV